ncbi:LapA family protein [Gordonia araii]|nr:LapA family protein [Gordonia araii]NNG95758.1 LapA family protein [Gordonia araii NBRC 100433]
MANNTQGTSFLGSVLNLVKKHWFPLAVAIIAIAFIALNRVPAEVNFLFFRVDIALWLALTVASVLGLIVGLFVARK